MSNSCFAVWGVIAGVFVPWMSTEGSPVLLPEVTVKKLFKVTDRYESDSSSSIDEEDELADGNTQFRLENVGEQGEDSEL